MASICLRCGRLSYVGEIHHCAPAINTESVPWLTASAARAQAQPVVDFTRAGELTPEVEAAVRDAFEYHKWTPEQIEAGTRVRTALELAVLQIIKDVPPGPDRTVAIRKLREARMDANSAITHGGKY